MNQTEEKWAPLNGFRNYAISSFGRVLNTKTNKFITPRPNVVNGYLQCVICQDGKTKGIRIHRAVAETFIPNPQNLPQVNHIDNNRQNACVSNLEWVSVKQNAAHKLFSKFFTFEDTTAPIIETAMV